MVDVLGFSINVSFPEIIFMIVILAAFIVISRKIMNTIFSMIWISAASASFPFVMSFAGFDFPTDFNSIVFFVMLGLGLYAVYIIGKLVYALLGVAEKAGKAVAYPISSVKKGRDKKMRKKMENLVREREKSKDAEKD